MRPSKAFLGLLCRSWTFIYIRRGEPCQTSSMELFVKIINGNSALTIFTKCLILDVWQGSEYTSDTCLSKYSAFSKLYSNWQTLPWRNCRGFLQHWCLFMGNCILPNGIMCYKIRQILGMLICLQYSISLSHNDDCLLANKWVIIISGIFPNAVKTTLLMYRWNFLLAILFLEFAKLLASHKPSHLTFLRLRLRVLRTLLTRLIYMLCAHYLSALISF